MSIRDDEIPSLKIGDIIYECQYGMNLEAEVLSAPVERDGNEGRRYWSWTAKNTQTGEIISFGLTEGLSHYGPRLYREPQYARFHNGELDFPLVGAPNPTPITEGEK